MPEDFAQGLPDKSKGSNPGRLPVDTVLTLVRQRHDAKRARTHEDLRIGDPAGLESWAVPKFLPEVENVKRLAIQQPIHRWSYKDFQGRLGRGYGEGLVTKLEESPVIITKNSPDHIMFTRGNTKDAPTYSMVRTDNGNWLVSIRRKDQPLSVREYPKEHFKSVPISEVPALLDQGAELTKKIDGAGVLLSLGKGGISAYGIRTGANGSKPEYTDIIGGLRSIPVPKEIRGELLRGEVYGQRDGKTIGANELAGILNSTLLNATWKKQGDGIKLMVAALARHKNGVDDYEPNAVRDIVEKLDTDKINTLRRYGGKDALKVLADMKRGADTLTHEGVVVHVPGKRPVKAKFMDDSDVVIRDIFKADSKDSRAGGFKYSLPGDDRIIGNVGTGFSHAMLKDMLANPEAYIGRTARIHSQEQYPSGAFRAPGFISMKED